MHGCSLMSIRWEDPKAVPIRSHYQLWLESLTKEMCTLLVLSMAEGKWGSVCGAEGHKTALLCLLRHQEASVFHFLNKFCYDNYNLLAYSIRGYIFIMEKKQIDSDNHWWQDILWLIKETC